MPVLFSSRRIKPFVLWSWRVLPARGRNNFISAASFLLLCEAVRVQFSDPYKSVGTVKGIKGWYWPPRVIIDVERQYPQILGNTVWHNIGQLCQQIRLPHVLARDPWAMPLLQLWQRKADEDEFSGPQNRDFRLRENTPTENGHVWRPGG